MSAIETVITVETVKPHIAPVPAPAPVADVEELVIHRVRGWIGVNFRELREFRELLYFLVWRDLKVRYKQTVLGVAWAVLQPLFNMAVFTMLNRLAKIGSENIRLEFKQGKIVNATGSNLKRLNEILNTDAGARYVGEFSLGFNPFILNPMCDILFDEKIAGSLHFTPGQAYEECDNGNRSAVHWDMVLIQRPEWGGGEVWFDGELIRKSGLFVPKDLKPLNPAHLK